MIDLSNIPTEVIEEGEQSVRMALVEAMGDGLSADEAIDLISAVLDVALPLKALLPPPIGAIAEAADRAAINAALTAIAGALSVDPDRIEARAQVAASRGHHLVAARRAARAQRIRDRRS